MVDDRTLIKDFLSRHTCYDLLPISSQVIVFDTTLPIKKAFYAMLQNGKILSSSCCVFLLSWGVHLSLVCFYPAPCRGPVCPLVG